MSTTRMPRDPQRGNSLLLALIVLSALATLGSLTVVSVQSNLQTSTNDRSQTIAMYAAESGGAVALDFLRTNTSWSSFLAPDNTLKALVFPSNAALPKTADNLFTQLPAYNAWYQVEVRNNRSDPGLVPGGNTDTDHQLVIRSTGHGPQGSVAVVEWEVQAPAPGPGPGIPMVLIGWHVVL